MTLASSKRWVVNILLISIGLKLIGLNQINGPVFDEALYPQYGLLYLQGEEFFMVSAIIIFVSFLYWLPIQMGFLIPDYEFYRRMWFNSWI